MLWAMSGHFVSEPNLHENGSGRFEIVYQLDFGVRLFFEGLPALLLGLWAGVTLYGKLNDAAFRKAMLVLLLFSGISLAVPMPLLLAGARAHPVNAAYINSTCQLNP